MAKIAFIGGGKMAEALLSRLRSVQDIMVSDIDSKRLRHLKRRYKIRTAANNSEAFKFGEIIILAVKPQNMEEVLEGIKPKTKDQRPKTKDQRPKTKDQRPKTEDQRPKTKDQRPKTLIISIAAGIPLKYLQGKLPSFPVVRAMPNNPCVVGKGITALSGGKGIKRVWFKRAEEIFNKVGETIVVPEKLMDAVTGLSGSGPAYVYEMIGALAEGGVRAGLKKEIASKLALQTVLGAAATVLGTGKTPHELSMMVASPGGTTIEGLKVLKKKKVALALQEAVVSAARKSKVLSSKWTS